MITIIENVITVDTEEEIKLVELFLEENHFDFDLLSNNFLVYDSIEELFEEFLDSSLEVLLDEGMAKRKIVIRGGKRKIIFRCKPGEKKIKRRCVRRKSSELAKMRRRARRAARKSKSKRGRALRKRRISLRRRKTIGGNKPHKH
jgi:hypothetical protein